MTEKTRGWLYRIGLATAPILVVYGLVGEAEVALWLGLLGAILTTGDLAMAASHTSVADPPPPPRSFTASRPPG
jgi:hypothetical protein